MKKVKAILTVNLVMSAKHISLEIRRVKLGSKICIVGQVFNVHQYFNRPKMVSSKFNCDILKD